MGRVNVAVTSKYCIPKRNSGHKCPQQFDFLIRPWLFGLFIRLSHWSYLAYGRIGSHSFPSKKLVRIHSQLLTFATSGKALSCSPEVIKKLPDRLRSFRGKTIVLYILPPILHSSDNNNIYLQRWNPHHPTPPLRQYALVPPSRPRVVQNNPGTSRFRRICYLRVRWSAAECS